MKLLISIFTTLITVGAFAQSETNQLLNMATLQAQLNRVGNQIGNCKVEVSRDQEYPSLFRVTLTSGDGTSETVLYNEIARTIRERLGVTSDNRGALGSHNSSFWFPPVNGESSHGWMGFYRSAGDDSNIVQSNNYRMIFFVNNATGQIDGAYAERERVNHWNFGENRRVENHLLCGETGLLQSSIDGTFAEDLETHRAQGQAVAQ